MGALAPSRLRSFPDGMLEPKWSVPALASCRFLAGEEFPHVGPLGRGCGREPEQGSRGPGLSPEGLGYIRSDPREAGTSGCDWLVRGRELGTHRAGTSRPALLVLCPAGFARRAVGPARRSVPGRLGVHLCFVRGSRSGTAFCHWVPKGLLVFGRAL